MTAVVFRALHTLRRAEYPAVFKCLLSLTPTLNALIAVQLFYFIIVNRG